MSEKILILDFGSQYTQLIARAVREANVYCEIITAPPNLPEGEAYNVKGIILSGSPFSVNDDGAPMADIKKLSEKLPVLGICYGAQLTAKAFGGIVEKSDKREYGRAVLKILQKNKLLKDVSETSNVWMSHSDTIKKLPDEFEILGTTESIPVAAFKTTISNHKTIYGLQFHPEVYHSREGKKIIKNFLVNICGCHQNWTPASFVKETIERLKQQIGDEHVIMGLSGGVDSTVAAFLISKAIGKRLHGIFVDNGVLRKNEFETVLNTYKQLDLNVTGIDAKQLFYDGLA